MTPSSSLALLGVAGSLLLTVAPLRAATLDDRIESSASKSYVFRTYLKDDAVKARSTNGAVTLTGTVAQASRKSLAEDTVASLPGVTGVDNRLIVKGDMALAKSSSTSKPESGEKIDDASITAQVKASLQAHGSTSALKTKVETADGVVTVSGVAGNAAEKSLVSKLISDINGVDSVVNNMTTEPAVSNSTRPRPVRMVQNLRIVNN